MVALAGVKAVRYLGVRTRKLWEVGGRDVPMMNRGDIVVVGETVAISLCRNKAMFEMIDVTPSFLVESLPEIVETKPTEDIVVDENPVADDQEPKKGKGK